ncbi:hypothetical protein EVAR_25095_1 [Eumeta japonica]|uniref:STPR domain-containing protein n=1 Tax=Eumeta variegata TaxID=151549 RepID=A0A4C1ZJD2_EUMVA|nr:hypothetical protein EVAR_25095_1 [Eumeta japonica]
MGQQSWRHSLRMERLDLHEVEGNAEAFGDPPRPEARGEPPLPPPPVSPPLQPNRFSCYGERGIKKPYELPCTRLLRTKKTPKLVIGFHCQPRGCHRTRLIDIVILSARNSSTGIHLNLLDVGSHKKFRRVLVPLSDTGARHSDWRSCQRHSGVSSSSSVGVAQSGAVGASAMAVNSTDKGYKGGGASGAHAIRRLASTQRRDYGTEAHWRGDIAGGGSPLLGRSWIRELGLSNINISLNDITHYEHRDGTDRIVDSLSKEFSDVFSSQLGTYSSQENLEENPANEVSDQNQDLGTVFQENRFNQVNVQETLPLARPTRAAKTRCLQNLTRIINEETSYDLNVPQERNRLRASQRVASESDELREQRLGDLRWRASHRVATESNEKREQRLEDQRRRTAKRVATETNEQREQRLEGQRRRTAKRVATETNEQREQRLEGQRRRTAKRVATETNEQREQRLEGQRRRTTKRVATETNEQREQRLEYQRRRASESLASESNEVREQRLEDLRLRASHRVATESDAQREHRLEEQRRRDIRRRRALESNYLPTYKCAVNADQLYHALGSFEVLCIHCGALHFPEERVSNRINRNSFSDCCLHGRILIEPPKVPNELVRLFLKRHPHSEEFHKKIRSINASFAGVFNVEDDRTINSRGIYSFIVCGQVYHKMNMAAHPTQNDEGVFERPLHGQLYF